jgi:hypothetical protein
MQKIIIMPFLTCKWPGAIILASSLSTMHPDQTLGGPRFSVLQASHLPYRWCPPLCGNCFIEELPVALAVALRWDGNDDKRYRIGLLLWRKFLSML